MATEKRLIDANVLEQHCKNTKIIELFPEWKDFPNAMKIALIRYGKAWKEIIQNTPTVDAVEVPCKIGDFVWAIRNFHGHKHPQRGIVSDMFFTKNMKLMIVVKYVARGEWGETVFATDKEAYAAIGVPCCPNCGAKMDK